MLSKHEHLIQIRDLIRIYFDLREVKDLCFDLGISYDDLPGDGEGKASRVRELVSYCERNGLVEHLWALCQRRRSDVIWPLFNDVLQRNSIPAFVSPPVRNPRQIFVSHAHQDAEFAHRLATDLRHVGWNIWIAPQSIYPGESWVTAINRGLAESSVFLLVQTSAAARSQWVRVETDAAISLAHQGEIRFIPLEVEPAYQLPLWRTYQWISFQEKYQTGWEQLMQALQGERQLSQPVLGKIEVAAIPIPTPKPMPPQVTNDGVIRVWEKDGKVMVYVPAGEFLYGEDKKTVYLDGFWIDKTPVTNVEYKRFLDVNPSYQVPHIASDIIPEWAKSYSWDQKKRTYPADKANFPVVLVSWYDAQAYAQWAGKRLPLEQEWEKAARGTDGREYPWGAWQADHANTEEAGIRGTSQVGQFTPQGESPYGCVDMSGNVWEWTDSWNDKEKGRRVVRGGSWYSDHKYAHVVFRSDYSPGFSYYDVGIRLVSRSKL